MDNQYTDEEEVLNNSANSNDIIETVEEADDSEQDDIEALREELNKTKSAYESQKIRAEKAEARAKAKQAEKSYSKQSNPELSTFDIIAVTKADLDEEGLKEVMDFAKYKGISVSEALKSPVIKATLAEKEENKRVAEASNTSGGRRGSSKMSDEALLINAEKGIMPDSDADIARLLKLRRAR